MSTLDYYNGNAKNYFDTTVGADMSKQYDLFLKYVRKNGRILDFGCGSGRDTLNFIKMGYNVDAIDGSEERGRKLWNAIFETIYEKDTRDGLPEAELRKVVERI